ncbi:histidine kinase [Paenimyroides ceti]
MNIRLFLFFLMFTTRLFSQNYTLREAPIRDEYNTYLICSAPFVDNNKFVWYSTNREGDFYRFDGKNKLRFSYYTGKNDHYDSSYISNYSWLQDSENNIWALKQNRVYIIKRKPPGYVVERILLERESIDRTVGIGMDKLKNIWISNGSRYLIRIDGKQQITKVSHPRLKQGKKSIQIFKTLQDGRLLAKSGYDIYFIDENGLNYFGNLQSIDKEMNAEFQFIENGKIFKENDSGVYRYNGKPFRYLYIKELNIQVFNRPYANIAPSYGYSDNKTVMYNDATVFIVNRNDIYINRFNKQKGEITTTDTLSFKTPVAINFSRQNPDFIWISTHDKLYKMLVSPNNFDKILQFKNSQLSTRTMVSDTKKNLYIGTYEGLYVVRNTNKKAEEVFIKNDKKGVFDAMYLEKNDHILWGYDEYGSLKRVDLSTRIKTSFKMPDETGQVTFVKEKGDSELWVGTTHGLYVFNTKTEQFHELKGTNNELKGIQFQHILQARDGRWWLATNKGLFFRDKRGDFLNYSVTNPDFKNKNILTLLEDEKGNLWIGTDGDGVLFLDLKTGHLKNYNVRDGLSNAIICGILESKNAFWFSTYYGLSRLDKKTDTFTVYFKEDGLPDNEFNLRSYYKAEDGVFYFGGLNGVVAFDPEKIQLPKENPYKIFLIEATYFSEKKNKNIKDCLCESESTDVINLPYNRNYFSATFTINELFYQESNTYYYKIEGLTNGWNDAGTSGKIELYSLPPGDYVVQVRGKDFKGTVTVNEKRIYLHVRQIFYKTPLFIGSITVLILFLIIYFFLRKINTQRKVFEREKEIAELKSSALRAQMNPHFLFNILSNLQSVLILKGEMEANKYFGAFSKLLRLTIEMSRQELVALETEIEYIKNYILLNNLQLNETIDYTVEVDSSIKNKAEILLPVMIVQPFVENAIIHGLSSKKDKKLEIRFSVENDYLIISVQDNGIGREASALLKKNSKRVYKSLATEIVNERMKIINDSYKNTMSIEIIDLFESGISLGTKVIIKFKML